MWVEQSSLFTNLALRVWIRRELVAVYTNHSWLGSQSRVSTAGGRHIRVPVAKQPLFTMDLKAVFKCIPRAMAVC